MKLEGLRVIDLSLFLPGPMLTQTMADHGAEVIKVETVDEGEPSRNIGLKRDGVSVWFVNTHRGKKSLTLNLKTAEGVEILMRLAERADVLVEAFRPGVVDRLGIGYRAVAERAPKIVYASIAAFGQTGPYVRRPAHDLAVEALAGVLSVNLGHDDRPFNPGLQGADMLASSTALAGILMALYRRHETGRGDYLDIAMMDSLIAAMPNNLGPVFAEGRAPVAKHERSWGGYAMFRPYETKDGRWIVLGGVEMKFTTNLLVALDRPDLIALCTLPPGPDQDPVKEFFTATFKTKTREQWVEWFDGRDICFGPVNSLREAFDDPQVIARGMRLVDHRGWEHVGTPIKFADEPGQQSFEAPAHGAHSEEIIRSLGFDDAELRAMSQKGVY